MLLAMQTLPGSEGLRNGASADWEVISTCMYTLNGCVASGKAPEKALRNKEVWSKAVDGCITAVLECCHGATQAAISRSDAVLLSSIGRTLSFCIGKAHGCLNSRPAWLRLQERPHGLQRSVEALVSVAQRIVTPAPVAQYSLLVASSPLLPVFYENIVTLGLSSAISLNESAPASQRLGEGLLVDLYCAQLKVSYRYCSPCKHAWMRTTFSCQQRATHGMP